MVWVAYSFVFFVFFVASWLRGFVA